MRGLAGIHLKRYELDRADAVLTEGRALVPALGAEDSRDGILVGVLSGRLALLRGDAERALGLFTLDDSVLARLSARDRLSLTRDLGRALSMLGRRDDALAELTGALDAIESDTAPGHVESAAYVQALIEHHVRHGEPARGVAVGEALLANWQTAESPNWQMALAVGAYATALSPQDPARARALLDEIDPVLSEVIGTDDRRLTALRAALR